MKNLFIIMLCTCVLFISCTKAGTIDQQPTEFIKIHGKTYKLMSVVPCDGCYAVWIMYPKDSLDKQPEVINFQVGSGKTIHNTALIKVD